MKESKQKIIDFAKELYLQYDNEGNKVFSLRDIATKIIQKFDKKLTAQTVKNWADKKDWNKINAKIKQQSIIKAKDAKFTADEIVIEKESDKLAKTYKYAEQLENIGFDIATKSYSGQEHALISFDQSLRAIKLGTDIKMRIMEIPDDNKDKGTQVIFQNVSTQFTIDKEGNTE